MSADLQPVALEYKPTGTAAAVEEALNGYMIDQPAENWAARYPMRIALLSLWNRAVQETMHQVVDKLRAHGYPITIRDEVIDNLVDAIEEQGDVPDVGLDGYSRSAWQ